jgi:hypothetical protein
MQATQLKMNETNEDMNTMHGNIQENLKKTMEEMKTMNQAKTDGKLKELLKQMKKQRWFYKR